MARRKRSQSSLNVWPGYVDALSTLLMVVTFDLLVFVVGQQFLSAAITQRENTLDTLKKEVSHLASMFSLSQRQVKDLKNTNDTLLSNYNHTKSALTAAEASLNAKEREYSEKNNQNQALQSAQQADILGLSAQVAELSRQLQTLTEALDIEKKAEVSKDEKIADLDKKLNIALADKINQLKKYRSEFFGRLHDLLKNQSGVTVVGDRFVFQSEILFPPGSATLSTQGKKQLRTLAHTFHDVSTSIPTDIPWILRVDGHADKQPIRTAFPSNWELSSARAITVVKMLIAEGIDPHHLAATGFSDNQPLDHGSSPEAYAHNRRIEFRLTDR